MKKIFTMLVTVAVVFATLATPVTFARADDSTAAGEVTIVHTNDIHGYYTETSGGVLGFAKLKGLIDSVKADVVVDAGDTFHGQAFATVEQGKSIAELMAAVGYDAMTTGNHDFSYGASTLKGLQSISGVPILASNIKENGQDYFSTPYVVKDVEVAGVGTVKVGILGVVDDEFYSSTASENVAGLTFEEEAAEATKVAATLRNNENCDIVIALTHQKDCASFVAKTSGIDAVIAGHEHKLIDETYTDKDGNSVKVVEAGYYFYNIGVLKIGIDNNKNIVSLAETVYSASDMTNITADATVQAKISEIESREQTTLATVVGQSDTEYAYSWEDIRVAEQEIGHIVTAAYLDRTGADIAMENAGGIRAGIPKGDITYKDIISISPYGNVLVTKTITGQELMDILETSIEIGIKCDEVYSLQKKAVENGEDPYQYSWPDNSGSYLQFGGISVVYDPTASVGERVISVKVGDEALDLQKTYTVATNKYVAESDAYPALSAKEIDKEYGTCEEVLIKFVQTGNLAEAAAKTVFTTGSRESESSELTTPETSDETSDGNTGEPSIISPETGEENGFWLFVLLVAAAAATGACVSGKRKKL